MSGESTERAASTRGDGSGAPSPRILPSILIAVLGLLILAVGAGSASAALRHTTVTYEFGEDGTSGTSFGNASTLAYRQATDRLYVADSGVLRAYSHPSAGTFTPVGGFPVTLEDCCGGFDQMAVDNSGTASAGNVYYAPDRNYVRGYDGNGNPLASPWPVQTGAETCGVGVDGTGLVWATRYGPSTVDGFNPNTGALQNSVSLDGGPSGPCKVGVDVTNNDLYPASYNGNGVWQYSAASGYSTKKLITVFGGNERVVVNGVKDIVYIGNGGQLKAFNTITGELIETISGLGSITEVTVDESSDTLFILGDGKVKEVPAALVPTVETGDPVGNTKVSGSVDPDGGGNVTECFFEYGENENYEGTISGTVPCEPATPYAGPQAVTATIPGLEGEVDYHYRLVAKNATLGGQNVGADKIITPHNVKGLLTKDATEITRVSAKLNATFEGNTEATDYYFEWGLTTAYGNVSAPPPGVSAGSPGTGVVTPLSFVANGLEAGKTYHYRVVAQNGLGISKANDKTFTTPEPVSNVTTDPASALTPTSATLNGSFDIDALGGATEYFFEFGLTTTYGSGTAPVAVGSTPGHPSVSATIGVEPATTYHYRIVVTNGLGTTVGNDQSFKSPSEPTINGLTSANVTATTAELIAKINPQGDPTSYRFEYGQTSAYGQVIPIPDGSAGSGNVPVDVRENLTGLQSGLAYHFRVVAENQWGTAVSQDQTFSFFTANCPNAHVRQQSGAASLPDCRAYELVSPELAGPVQLFPGIGIGPIVQEFIPMPPPSNTGHANSPARFAFWGGIGQVNGTNPPNILQDMYVATRGSTGWTTHYPGLPASASFASGGTTCNAELSECMNYDIADPLELDPNDDGSNAPYVFDVNQNSVSVRRFPTNLDEITDGEEFIGDTNVASDDFGHFAFSSNNIAFAPGGKTSAPGSAYDNDTVADTVDLISKLPGGADIAQDPAGCTTETGKQRQCKEEFVRVQDISSDGSHILLSNWAEPTKSEFPNKQKEIDAFKRFDVHLTMEVDGLSYDITDGASAYFAGMTPDGSRVFFTSRDPVTGDDTDESVDLFMWEESTGLVTRVSAGKEGTGDSDDCKTEWSPDKCDVQLPNFEIDTIGEIPGEISTPDNWISDSGDIYFYSPEQLAGLGKGSGNSRNLFVYRDDEVQFVATFDENRPAARLQVTPSGDRAAILTSSELTSYESGGFREMYSFDPDKSEKEGRFVCVSCQPTGEAAESSAAGAENGLFMSDDGRVFFSSKDGLVPYDSNKLRDVYEYVDGRPQLISSGTANQDTWGGGLLIYPPMTAGLEGVSADGIDVYFSTFDSLVPTDQNGEFIKFYDARSGGGFPYQEPRPPCKAADECHFGGSVPPAPPQVGTSAQLGKSGNVRKSTKCKKGSVKKNGKCVKKKGKKKKRAASKRSRANG